MDHLTQLFCLIDDFCREFEPAWERRLLAAGAKKRRRKTGPGLSELLTLLVLFHQLRFRQFKSFYLAYARRHLRREFPRLPAYARCVELLPRCAVPLAALFEALKGRCDGVSVIDSTALAVCDNTPLDRHRVFRGKAARGKTSMGWFFGFKLHLVVNSKGGPPNLRLTPGNTDDRKPVQGLCGGLFGLLLGGRRYISKKLAETLAGRGVELITRARKNMKPAPRTGFETRLLRRRSLVETVIDELKNLCQIEHTRHRSITNFTVNLMAGIVACCLSDSKPTFNLIRVNALVKA